MHNPKLPGNYLRKRYTAMEAKPQALLKTSAHHQTPQTHHFISAVFVFYSIIAHLWNLGNLAFLESESTFKFPDALEFGELLTARGRTTVSETVILKQAMKLHCSGIARVFSLKLGFALLL